MNRDFRRKASLLLLIVVIAGLLALAAGGDVAYAKKHNPPVLPPHSSAFGHTYEEWAAKWWQWVYNTPGPENHPLFVDDEIDCSVGQEGKVWFLAGSWDLIVPDPEAPTDIYIWGSELGQANRTCDVPVGKALFFPVVNIICTGFAGDEPDALLECAANPDAPVPVEFVNMSATIDGKEVQGLDDYRFPGWDPPDPQVPPMYFVLSNETFELGPLPDPNVAGAEPESVAPAATNGIYLLVPPLSRGEHIVKFDGQLIIPGYYSYRVDITYNLTAVPLRNMRTLESVVTIVE